MDLLLILRGLAALSVIVWHTVGYQNELPSLLNTPGRTAVWLFFGLSGYVIAYGFVHKRYKLTTADLKDFYINRFLRIYPLFLTLSLISYATYWIINASPIPIALGNLPAQLLAFQFNHAYVLSGVFWTLGIEIQFYVIAPLLVMPILMVSEKAFKTRFIAICFIYFVMVSYVYYAAHFLGWSYDGRNLFANLPHFFVGMAACLITSKFKPSKARFNVSILISLTLLAYTNWLYSESSGKFWSTSGLMKVDLMIFMFILAHASLSRDRFKSNKLYIPFALLGTLSYGIYAWHAYLMKYLPELSDEPFMLIVISVGVAYLSYRFIESPALRLKREKNHSPIH